MVVSSTFSKMHSARVSFAIVILFLVVLGAHVERVKCQDDDEGGGEDEGPEETPPEKTCTQTLLSFVTDITPIIPKCLFGPNVINLRLTSIFQALPRIYCVIKCVMAELTVFQPDGQIDEVAALLFFQESFPEYALAPIVEKAQPCLGLAGDFKPNQYYCQSYGPLIRCFSNVLVTGIGPFALECLGTPFFAGLFGILNFIIPPERPEPGEEARRRRIWTSITHTVSTSGSDSMLARVKERREKIRIKEEKAEAQRRLNVNAPPTFATAGMDVIDPTTPLPSNVPPPRTTTSPLIFVNNKNYSSNRSRNNLNRSWQQPWEVGNQGFNTDFLWNNTNSYNIFNYKNYNSKFHTNNSDTIVYQMDRFANFAKSLQMLLNNTATGRF